MTRHWLMSCGFWSILGVLIWVDQNSIGAKPLPVKKDSGLAAKAELKTAGDDYLVHFRLENSSSKPITIFNFVGSRPLQVKWIGPDGKERESKHYEWLKAARLRPPTKANFVTLAPGKSLSISPGGTDGGIAFKDMESGKHRITVSYENKESGKTYGVKDVFVGKVTAKQLVFEVKK